MILLDGRALSKTIKEETIEVEARRKRQQNKQRRSKWLQPTKARRRRIFVLHYSAIEVEAP